MIFKTERLVRKWKSDRHFDLLDVIGTLLLQKLKAREFQKVPGLNISVCKQNAAEELWVLSRP